MTTADLILQALQPYKLREEGRGKYRCNSPLRPGSNSHAFSLTIEGDEHGAYYDFVSGDKGSLYELAEKLGIEIPKDSKPLATAEYTTKRAYENLGDYAIQHGCPEQVFRAAGWSPIEKSGRPALVFPTKTGDRYRFLDGEQPSFWHQSGYKSCWYGLLRAMEVAERTGTPLILTNGEPSVVAAQYYGVPACCITGSGERVPPAHLIDELRATYQGKIIVALDCDKKGREAAPKIVTALRQSGYDTWAVDLGGTSKGFDLADFCRLHQADAWNKIPTLEPLYRTPRLGKSGRDLMRMVFPPVRWIIPEILPEGLTICAGKPKLGKSWLWLNIALAAAGGGVVLGDVRVEPCNVLFLSLEDGERRLRQRIETLGYTEHTIPEGFQYEDAIPRLDDGAIALMDTWIQEHGGRNNLIVIDTLVMVKMAQKGNQNIYDQDYNGLSELRTLAQSHPGTGIVLIHHTRKNGAEDAYEMILGSMGIQGVVETLMLLNKQQEQVYLELKGKDVEEKKIPLKFDSQTNQWIRLQRAMPISTTSMARQEILDYLEDNPFSKVKDIAQALDKPYNAIVQTLKRMTDSEEIIRTSEGYALPQLEEKERA